MVANPAIFDVPTRLDFLPQPGDDFVLDVAGETPMRQLALQNVARERDAMFRNRMQSAGPPTPNQAPSTAAPGTPGEGYPPSPGMTPAVRPPAGPRLLSPPEWASKFMPNLAQQPYLSKRQLRLLDAGYKAYVVEVQNTQQQAHYAQQDARANRTIDLGEAREERYEKRYDIQDARAIREEAGRERRHQEDIASREAIANRKAELSPQDQAFKNAFDAAYAKTPDDPMAALAQASLAAKGGAGAGSDNPMNTLTAEAIAELKAQGKGPTDIMGQLAQEKRPDASLFDKGEFQKTLTGGVLGGDAGLTTNPEWETDPMAAFKKYAAYVKAQMSFASPQERVLLQQSIKERAPYKTADEVRAAYAAGKFDPPIADKGFWSTTPADRQRKAKRAAGMPVDLTPEEQQQAKQAAEDYLRLLSGG